MDGKELTDTLILIIEQAESQEEAQKAVDWLTSELREEKPTGPQVNSSAFRRKSLSEFHTYYKEIRRTPTAKGEYCYDTVAKRRVSCKQGEGTAKPESTTKTEKPKREVKPKVEKPKRETKPKTEKLPLNAGREAIQGDINSLVDTLSKMSIADL